MPTEAELQEQYKKASVEFAVRTTVFLAPCGRLAEGLSGVLLRSADGVPFIVTAKHMATDDEWNPVEWRPLTIFVPALNTEIRNVADHVFVAPLPLGRQPEKPLDVAIVRLRPAFHDLLRPLAAGIEAIAADDQYDQARDVILLTGFPGYLAFQSTTDPRMLMVSNMTHYTGITGRDEHGRLEVEWKDAIPHEGHPGYPHLNVQAGKTMQLGHPGGISGGGIWRIRGAPASAIWSPSSHAKLIGVPVAYLESKDTEFAESVATWGAWLKETSQNLNQPAPDGPFATS